MNASSSGTSRQLSGTTTAPSLATAKNVSSNSTEFIISNPTRSPRPTPASVSTWAVRLTRSLSSANVKRRSVSTSTNASRSGLSRARLETKCPMFVDGDGISHHRIPSWSRVTGGTPHAVAISGWRPPREIAPANVSTISSISPSVTISGQPIITPSGTGPEPAG